LVAILTSNGEPVDFIFLFVVGPLFFVFIELVLFFIVEPLFLVLQEVFVVPDLLVFYDSVLQLLHGEARELLRIKLDLFGCAVVFFPENAATLWASYSGHNSLRLNIFDGY